MNSYPLLRLEEVAGRLAVSKPSVRRLALSGVLASLLIARRLERAVSVLQHLVVELETYPREWS